MAAEDHLGTQFFHGSVAPLKEGDIIHPGNAVGQRNYPGHAKWRGDHVWATPNERGAWRYARNAESESRDAQGNGLRPRVFEVEPVGDVQKRRRMSAADPEEHTMQAARVKRVIDIPSPETRRDGGLKPGPIQGELPTHESWDNFGGWVRMKGEEPKTNWDELFARQKQWAAANTTRGLHTTYAEPEKKDETKPSDHPGQRRLF